MNKQLSAAAGLLVTVISAALFVVLYFGLTGRWTQLADPIAAIVAMAGGTVGFVLGTAVDKRRTHRSADAG